MILLKSWEDVKADTIKNCFRKTGFSKNESYSIKEEELDEPVPEEWSDFQNVVSCQENYDSFFVNVDADILIAEHPTDEEIIESVTAQQNDSELDDNMDITEDEVSQLKPTICGPGFRCADHFSLLHPRQSSVHEDVFRVVNLLENFVEKQGVAE